MPVVAGAESGGGGDRSLRLSEYLPSQMDVRIFAYAKMSWFAGLQSYPNCRARFEYPILVLAGITSNSLHRKFGLVSRNPWCPLIIQAEFVCDNGFAYPNNFIAG